MGSERSAGVNSEVSRGHLKSGGGGGAVGECSNGIARVIATSIGMYDVIQKVACTHYTGKDPDSEIVQL